MQPIKWIVFAIILIQFAACKKENNTAPGKNTTVRRISMLPNYEYNGTSWQRNGFMLFDIDHADNKDKQYMVIDVENSSSGYKFVKKKGPFNIDQLAAGWPPEVRFAAFGLSNDFIIDANMRMQVQSFSGNQFVYRYDSLYKFSTAIYTYNYLNNATLYAGAMAGKPPQGRAGFWQPDDKGNSIPLDIIYYFKEGYFTNVIGIGNSPQPLTTMTNGIRTISEDWKTIDAVLTLEGTYYTHFYFDFDKWRFFYFKDFCQSIYGAPCDAGIQQADFMSMDLLMDWPQSWKQ